MRHLVPKLGVASVLLGLGTSAHAAKVDDLLASLAQQLGAVFNVFLTGCTFLGVWFVFVGLRGLHESSKDGQQALPLRAYLVAFFAGGALTCVAVWAAMVANSLSV